MLLRIISCDLWDLSSLFSHDHYLGEMATFNSFPLMLLAFPFSVLKTWCSTGYLAPSEGRHSQSHQSPFCPGLSSACAGRLARVPTVPFPLQGCPHYLHLLHLHLHQQHPCFLRAQRRPHSSRPRLWMAWAEGPYSAPSRTFRKELWGKPKPVIIVLLRSARALCLHLEGEVLFFPFYLQPLKVLSSWMNDCWASTATYYLMDAHVRAFPRGTYSSRMKSGWHCCLKKHFAPLLPF